MWRLLAWVLLFFLSITGLSLLMQARSPRAVPSRNSPCWLCHQFPVASPSTSCDQPPSHCTCSGSASPSPPAAATSVTSPLTTLSLGLLHPWVSWPPPLQNHLGLPGTSSFGASSEGLVPSQPHFLPLSPGPL